MTTILLVEDDQETRAGFLRCLADAGYEIREAESASEAIGAVRRERPDAIVVAAQMQEAEQVVALQQIREIDHTIPVVLYMSASLYENDIRYQLADSFVLKSAGPDTLRQAVAELTGTRPESLR